MIQHEFTIQLDRPVEQVFAFLVDTRNLPMWQSNLIESEHLTDGSLGVGSHFREIRRLGRRPAEIRAKITVFEPNRRFETETETAPHVTVSYAVEAEDGGTCLRYKFVMRTHGLMRLLEPIIVSSIKKQTASDFAQLKRVLER